MSTYQPDLLDLPAGLRYRRLAYLDNAKRALQTNCAAALAVKHDLIELSSDVAGLPRLNGGNRFNQGLGHLLAEYLTHLQDDTTYRLLQDIFGAELRKHHIAACVCGSSGNRGVGPWSDLDLFFTARSTEAFSHFVKQEQDFGLLETTFQERLKAAGLRWNRYTVISADLPNLLLKDVRAAAAISSLRFITGDQQAAIDLRDAYRSFFSTGAEIEAVLHTLLAEAVARQESAGVHSDTMQCNFKDGAWRDRSMLRAVYTIGQLARRAGMPFPILLKKPEIHRFIAAEDKLLLIKHGLHFVRFPEAPPRSVGDAALKYFGPQEAAAVVDTFPRCFGREETAAALLQSYHKSAGEMASLLLVVRSRLEQHWQTPPSALAGSWIPFPSEFRSDCRRLLSSGSTADLVSLIIQRIGQSVRGASGPAVSDLSPGDYRDVSWLKGEIVPKITLAQSAEPAVWDAFRSTLGELNGVGLRVRLLWRMGLLGKISPLWQSQIEKNAQTDGNRRYSLAEHHVRAVERLESLFHEGIIGHAEFKRSVGFPGQVSALVLATLLHDCGLKQEKKPDEHPLLGSGLVRTEMERLGYSAAETDFAADLVAQHRLLKVIFPSWYGGDPTAAAAAAAVLKVRQNAKALFLLTLADQISSNEDNWTEGKTELLYDLFRSIYDICRQPQERPLAVVPSAPLVMAAVEEAGLQLSESRVLKHLAELDHTYTATQTPLFVAWHVELIRRLEEGEQSISGVWIPHDNQHRWLLVAARDRVGLFRDLAAALALRSHDLQLARLFTYRSTPLACNSLMIRTPYELYPSDSQRILADIENAVGGKTNPAHEMWRRRVSIPPHDVRTSIAIDLTPAGLAGLRIKSANTPGLAGRIGSILADHRFSVKSANLLSGQLDVMDYFVLAPVPQRVLGVAELRRLQFDLLRELDPPAAAELPEPPAPIYC